ncbi:MAG: TRAP transporter substrate-binding protein DctP [Deltaproteobacteria bacterium]|nr:TRAP transporter substrate-binding protein DctP [Deltaproteobacteria bacterium]
MSLEKCFRFYFITFLAALLLFSGYTIALAVTTVKVAVVMPEGSAWTNALRNMASEIEKQTHGEIKFKIYAGGVSGDEVDVIRKMQVNRIHAAGFSGVGLGILLPKIRILEAPMLYQSYQEVDLLKEKFYDEFSADFAKKGYVLLGFVEAGFVYFFSKIPMSGPDGLKNVRMWVWKSDAVAKTTLEAFGIKTYPLHIADVNTGLETGMIDSFYSPPLAAIVFQWFTKIQYFLDYPIVNSTGALLIKKSIFDKVSSKNQEIFKKTAKKYCRELVLISRKENQKALAVLKKENIVIEAPTQKQITSFYLDAREIYKKSIPQLYSKNLFERAQNILNAHRNTQTSSE